MMEVVSVSESTSVEHLSDLMQQVHLNNVDLHKFLKRNRRSIDIEDVKKVNYSNINFSDLSTTTELKLVNRYFNSF